MIGAILESPRALLARLDPGPRCQSCHGPLDERCPTINPKIQRTATLCQFCAWMEWIDAKAKGAKA